MFVGQDVQEKKIQKDPNFYLLETGVVVEYFSLEAKKDLQRSAT